MKVLNGKISAVEESLLYKKLLERANTSAELLHNVDTVIEMSLQLQKLIISGPFKNYTLHDEVHSLKLLNLSGELIGDSLISQLSALEISLIIMAIYTHDLGMVLTDYERSKLISNKDFQYYFKLRSDLSERITKLQEETTEDDVEQKNENQFKIFEIYEAIISEYLRPRHAEKLKYEQIYNQMKKDSNNNNLFSYKSIPFERYLIDICHSHNEQASYLMETKGLHAELFPRDLTIVDQMVNLQFCAAVLRIADILDFDCERTPQTLFNALGVNFKNIPTSTVSLKEWKKHMAVHSLLSNEGELIINAHCDHPAIEKSVRDFAHIIEVELRNTNAILSKNVAEIKEKYKLLLPLSVRTRITSNGYVYKDYSLRLNEKQIMNLLMGEQLYANASVAVRELIQNSIDACLLRKELSDQEYKPKIFLSLYKENTEYFLKIEDNGIGMDDYVLNNYFFKIGNSYYNSSDFEKLKVKNEIKDFNPISRFGIGLLSVFMICDFVKVKTSNKKSVFSDNVTRNLTIDGVNTIAFVTESEDDYWGTEIILKLKSPYDNKEGMNQLLGFIKENIIRPNVPIECEFLETVLQINNEKSYISFKRSQIDILNKLNIEVCVIDVSRFSDMLVGKIIFFFIKMSDGSLRIFDEKKLIVMGKSPLKETDLFENFQGLGRITVNGIRMNMKKIGSLFNIGNTILNYVVDIEVKSSSRLVYDVSRDRIIGNGIYLVRREIFKVVKRFFGQTGLHDRFSENDRLYFEKVEYQKMQSRKLDEDKCQYIISKINDKGWRTGIHKEIAKELDISNFEASKYITALLHLKRLKKQD